MSGAAIRILADRVVDQIAAGEVVERPASVVKELVENSLDAGAKHVVIALRDGGRSLVRVEDDGRGMVEQDALLSIERHATSKIRETGDLLSLASLGFRGEALPSIAAVSEFELVTRTPDDEQGTRVRVDGGRLRDVRPTGAAVGTVISAKRLFYNVPVRQKFLRTVPTELGHCVNAVVRQAMVRPRVGFSVQHGGRTILDAPPTDDWAVRVEALVGPDGRGLVPIEASSDGMRLKGYAAAPERHRAHAADSTFLYVNGRWVRDHVLRRAIREAYRDRLPSGRYPLAVLELRLDPALADINVHPTKAEVRFVDPASVVRFVAHTVSAALEQAGAAPRRSVGSGTPYLASTAPLFAGSPSVDPASVGVPEASDPDGEEPGRTDAASVVAPAPRPGEPSIVAGSPAASPAPSRGSAATADVAPPPVELRFVDVVAGRWGLAELGERLFVADLGRVARRLTALDARSPGRPLLVPTVLRLPEGDLTRAEDQLSDWAELGLGADRFSPTELAVRSVPESLADVEPEALVRLALEAPDDVRTAWARGLPAPPGDDGPAVGEAAHARGILIEGRLVDLDRVGGEAFGW